MKALKHRLCHNYFKEPKVAITSTQKQQVL